MQDNPLNRIFAACNDAMQQELTLREDRKQLRLERDRLQDNLYCIAGIIAKAVDEGHLDRNLGDELLRAAGLLAVTIRVPAQ